MRFWDASAIVPLLVRENETERCLSALRTDPEVLVWTMSEIEVMSALCRRYREGRFNESDFDGILARMNEFFSHVIEIVQVQRVKSRALRLLQVHALRAADALQLGAALIATEEEPSRLAIMSFDVWLNQAAKREGFRINPEQ